MIGLPTKMRKVDEDDASKHSYDSSSEDDEPGILLKNLDSDSEDADDASSKSDLSSKSSASSKMSSLANELVEEIENIGEDIDDIPPAREAKVGRRKTEIKREKISPSMSSLERAEAWDDENENDENENDENDESRGKEKDSLFSRYKYYLFIALIVLFLCAFYYYFYVSGAEKKGFSELDHEDIEERERDRVKKKKAEKKEKAKIGVPHIEQIDDNVNEERPYHHYDPLFEPISF